MNDVRRVCLVAAVVAALGLTTAWAQTISIVDDAKLPRFEVASVKPGDPNATSARFGIPPGRFVQNDLDLFSAVMMAFSVRPYQIATPLPDLITRERFTINAQAPAGAKGPERALMVRALPIDRFKLRYHVDRSETTGYLLTVARRDGRLGPTLRASAVDCLARQSAQAKEPVAPLPDGAAACGVRTAAKVPLDRLVIDHIERPDPD